MTDATVRRSPQRLASFLSLVAVVALLAPVGCDAPGPAYDDPARSPLPAVADRLVFEEVVAADVAAVVSLPGAIALPPQAIHDVGPTILGRIERWHVTTGDHVAVESPLADVVSTELADLESGARELERVIKDRRRLLRRQREHVKAGMQPVQSVYEAQIALSEAQARKAAIDRQLEARRKLGAEVEDGGMQWTWAAPVEGIVQSLSCAPGTVQGPAARCLRILDTSQGELRVAIPERFLPRVYAGLRALWLPAWERDPSRALEMRLFRTDPLVDAETRTQAHFFRPVDAADPRAKGWLTPGATGRVTVLTPAEADTVRVPRLAVVTIDGQPTIFVAPPASVASSGAAADSNGAASGEPEVVPAMPEAVPVTVVGHFEGDPIVRSERLRPGDRVVARGAFLLKSITLLGQE